MPKFYDDLVRKYMSRSFENAKEVIDAMEDSHKAQPKKKRGRPVGSKNKPRVKS